LSTVRRGTACTRRYDPASLIVWPSPQKRQLYASRTILALARATSGRWTNAIHSTALED
jgi:hypothetical protein